MSEHPPYTHAHTYLSASPLSTQFDLFVGMHQSELALQCEISGKPHKEQDQMLWQAPIGYIYIFFAVVTCCHKVKDKHK